MFMILLGDTHDALDQIGAWWHLVVQSIIRFDQKYSLTVIVPRMWKITIYPVKSETLIVSGSIKSCRQGFFLYP